MNKEQEEKQYKDWKEVPKEKGNYAIILRPSSYDTNVMFYMNQEDMLWAMKNSWFDPKEAITAKILPWDISLPSKHLEN